MNHSSKTLGVIPARYGSTRFPGKPLVQLMNKPMIQHVVERVSQASSISKVIVATDDSRIDEAVKAFGGNSVMTSNDHTSGTSRCAEVLSILEEEYDFVVNIQGDEPLIQPSQIDQLVRLLHLKDVQIASLARPIDQSSQIDSEDVVKVVTSTQDFALYFSRSKIPFERNSKTSPFLQHIGIYGFQTQVLQELVTLPPSPLEIAESLEQLRWLEHGYKIKMGFTNDPTFAIDSPEDVELVINEMKKNG